MKKVLGAFIVSIMLAIGAGVLYNAKNPPTGITIIAPEEIKATTTSEVKVPSASVRITNPLSVRAGETVTIRWQADNAPAGSKVAIFDGIYIQTNLDPSAGEVTLRIPIDVFCGDVGWEVKEISVVLYSDPDDVLTHWCTTDLPNGASGTKNIKIYGKASIPVTTAEQQ